MNRLFARSFLGLSLAVCFTAPMQADVVYLDNFDVDTSAAWNVNASTGNNAATFGYNYSAVGIPTAPNSVGGTTRGLKLEANYNGGPAAAAFTGLSVSPKLQSFVGDYSVHADVWLNFLGPGPNGGSGTTEIAGMGVRTNGISPQWAGVTPASVYFGTTVDGGSGQDWRVYTPSLTTGASLAPASGAYAAGTGSTAQNNSDTFYTTNFPATAIPATQTATDAAPVSQTGSSMAGVVAFAWHDWAITKTGDTIVWSIDGTTVATVTPTNGSTSPSLAGDNILLNMFDSNTGASTDAASRLYTFALFDNVRVIAAVPEAGSLLFGGVAVTASAAFCWLHRRSAGA